MTAIGHNRPVTFSRPRPFERRHHTETCRMVYFSTSAKTDRVPKVVDGRQCAGYLSL